MLKKYLLALGILFIAWPALAQENPVELLFFYSPTCPHCHNVEGELNNFQEKYPNLEVTSYDVTGEEGNKIFLQLSDIYNQNLNSVPVVLINDKILTGDATSTINEIESQIEYCSVTNCELPSEKISSWQENNQSSNPQQQKAIYVLIALGIIIVFIVITILFKGKKSE